MSSGKSDNNPDQTETVTTNTKVTRRIYEEGPSFKSYMSPRSTTIVTRHVSSGLAPGSSKFGNLVGGPMGGFQHQSNVRSTPSRSLGGPFSTTKNEREKEKRDLQQLNERLAGYVEKVRFLEAQNRKLDAEIENLKNRWEGDSSGIKQMYETELGTAREIIEGTEKEKEKLDDQLQKLEDELNDLKYQLDELDNQNKADKETIERQDQQLAELEPELNLLRRNIAMMEEDQARDRRDIQRLQQDLMRTKIDLDNETMAHLDAETRKQALEEELELLKQAFDQEIKELSLQAYRDTTPEMREYWTSELSDALRQIQDDYDTKLDLLRNEIETNYNMKVNELTSGIQRQNVDVAVSKEDNKKLKNTLNDLNHKLDDLDNKNALLEKQIEDLLKDFDDKEKDWDNEKNDYKDKRDKLKDELEQVQKESEKLTDKQLSLELEIAAYKKLMDTGETNLGRGVETSGAVLRDILLGQAGSDAAEWNMKVYTSDIKSAGTDANVRMVLYGEKGQTNVVNLDKRNKDDFEKGKLSEFRSYPLRDIGQPFKMRIWHDNKGLGPGWHLDKIEAENTVTNNNYTFKCGRWLAKDEDDKQIIREMPAEGAGIKTLPQFRYEMSLHLGDTKGTPVDTKPFVCLFGEYGDTGERPLVISKTGSKAKFEKNQVETFIIEAVYLGRIDKLMIGHEASRSGRGFFVDKIAIKTLEDASYMAEFKCNKWLAIDEGDKQVVREFTAENTSVGKSQV